MVSPQLFCQVFYFGNGVQVFLLVSAWPDLHVPESWKAMRTDGSMGERRRGKSKWILVCGDCKGERTPLLEAVPEGGASAFSQGVGKI